MLRDAKRKRKEDEDTPVAVPLVPVATAVVAAAADAAVALAVGAMGGDASSVDGDDVKLKTQNDSVDAGRGSSPTRNTIKPNEPACLFVLLALFSTCVHPTEDAFYEQGKLVAEREVRVKARMKLRSHRICLRRRTSLVQTGCFCSPRNSLLGAETLATCKSP